ncbi:MAG: ParB/RepB/Spo0J family partition protein [Clostridia bacterium]|nr:ParB/RepB/Spo0J family partition protein [Clostridia bacterium]
MWKCKKKQEKIQLLKPDLIDPNPYAARRRFSTEELRSLAGSIARYGMLCPITVRKLGDGYQLLLGERRLRAAKMLEMEEVPCRILDVNGRMGAEMTLIENLQRADLDFFEEAAAMDRLIRQFHYTQGELADRLGQSQSAVANKIRLLKLDSQERLLITENGLTQRHARALLRIQDSDTRLFALKFIIDRGYSVGQSEAFVEALLSHPDEFLVSGKVSQAPKPVRKLVVKDVRLFVNSVDKAIFHIREAGFSIEADKVDEENYISYSIRVPKYGQTSKT